MAKFPSNINHDYGTVSMVNTYKERPLSIAKQNRYFNIDDKHSRIRMYIFAHK